MDKDLEPRKRIPRRAKNNILRTDEIKMIKEVLQQERLLKRKCQKKEKSLKDVSSVKSCEGSEEVCVEKSQCDSNVEIGDNEVTSKVKTEENCPVKALPNKLTNSGLCHFMDLEERKDLLMSQADDPLCVNGPETFDSIDWVSVKQEVPDDVEVSRVIFTEIPLKGVVEPKTCSPEPIIFTSQLSPSSGCNSPLSVKNETLNQNSPKTNDRDSAENVDNIKKNDDDDDSLANDDWWSGDNDNDNELSEDEKKDFKILLPPIITTKHKSRSHNCDICNKKLSSKGSLRLHKKKKHQIMKVFNCELCSLGFDSHRDLVVHRNEIHKGADGKFTCNECGVVRNDFRNFLIHTKSHYGINNSIKGDFNCKLCDKTFEKEDDLLGHSSSVHNDDDDGDIFSGDTFKKQKKNYVCHTCGKRFAFGCLLRDHVNLHTGTKPYLCQMCGRSFSQKASLKQHARTHNSVRPFQCTLCSQGFFGNGDLKKHMRKHTGERPYVCEICGDGFSQSSHLGVHRRSHTGERPYKCDVCSRGFTKKGDVVRHRRIHTGELPYLCQVCGKAFRQSTQCSNHIKNHHPDALVIVSKNPAPVSQWLY